LTLYYNSPIEPRELQILKILTDRMDIPSDSTKRHYNLQKGYEGEVKFHTALKENLSSDCLVLYDLCLDEKGSNFQTDCIIIKQRKIYYIEVKNFVGDYMIEDNTLYNLTSKKEVNNPISQMKRGKRLLEELLGKHGFNFPIKPYTIFIHSEFALYQLPTTLPLVLPNQIHRFINNINNTHSKLSSVHYKLAQRLLSVQNPSSSSNQVPEYEFEQLKKGIRCLHCDGYLVDGDFHRRILSCNLCGCPESRESAIIRSVDEYSILFPERKITTNAIWSWCGEVISKYKIRNVLFQFLKPIGEKNRLYFNSPYKR